MEGPIYARLAVDPLGFLPGGSHGGEGLILGLGSVGDTYAGILYKNQYGGDESAVTHIVVEGIDGQPEGEWSLDLRVVFRNGHVDAKELVMIAFTDSQGIVRLDVRCLDGDTATVRGAGELPRHEGGLSVDIHDVWVASVNGEPNADEQVPQCRRGCFLYE